jgi:hypothetical protein
MQWPRQQKVFFDAHTVYARTRSRRLVSICAAAKGCAKKLQRPDETPTNVFDELFLT